MIARDPAAVARRLAINCVTHLRDDAHLLLGWPVAACAAIGAVLALRGGAFARQWPLALAAAVSFLALVPVFHSERYSLMLLPYYAIAAAALFAAPAFALVLGGRLTLKPALAILPSRSRSPPRSTSSAAPWPSSRPKRWPRPATPAHPRATGDRVIARKAASPPSRA